MTCELTQITNAFYNIRGSFKIAGVIDIGTHASLVQLQNGRFVFLDAYTLTEKVAGQVAELTDDGKDIEAIINLHPFHTLHVQAMHERYPQAKLFGTTRHLKMLPDLPWKRELTESEEMHALYANDFDFSVPAGVDFISTNQNLHFSSVLARHRDSKTIHVDDTLMVIRLPLPMRLLGHRELVSFHPTLAKTLEPHAGAADEFRQWASHLALDWSDTENLCAAHSATLTLDGDSGDSIAQRINAALEKVERKLVAHENRYG